MAADGSAPNPKQSAVGAARRDSDLVPSGAAFVGLSERFYARVFVGAVGFVGLAALAALVLLPVVQFEAGAPVAAAAVATALIVASTPLALWRSRTLYCALRSRPALQLAFVLVAALLVADPRLSSELWWPSCAILMALAIVAPLSQTLTYCALVLGTNLAGHVASADLDETPAVEIIGLWIGYPLWVALVAIVTDRLVAYLMRLNVPTPPGRHMPPRSVRASAAAPPAAGGAGSSNPATAVARSHVERTVAATGERKTDGLTARQLQVVALLADGLRHREIAACLSISERQVQRHVAEAIARLGLQTAYELTAIAVSEDACRDTPHVDTGRTGSHGSP